MMSCEGISVNVLASKRLQVKKKGQDQKSCPLAEAVGVSSRGKLRSRLLGQVKTGIVKYLSCGKCEIMTCGHCEIGCYASGEMK